jgi:hypothetical protein
MAELIPAGILIHCRDDWPCDSCRAPDPDVPGSGFLCLECATSLVTMATEMIKSARVDRDRLAYVLDSQAADSECALQSLPWLVRWTRFPRS